MSSPETKNVLEVDLTAQHWKRTARGDLAAHLGGIGLASGLFLEELRASRDVDRTFVLAVGPLSTIFPLATKTAAVFRSPLTGEWGESYAGMRLAMALRFAGYDAVVVRGRSERPIYITISSAGVRFHNATALWGLSVEEAGRRLREWERGRGHRSTMRIGPAGEKGIAFAGVNVDTFRHFGRLGLGAVMGGQNLKAVVVIGEQSQPIPNAREYRKVYDDIYRRAVTTDVMRKYHDLGTAQNVLHLNELGALPTRNLRYGSFEHAEKISGEAFARETLIRKLSCAGCPVGCIHVGLYRREFAEGYEYESETLAYDFELIYALGSFLGLSRTADVYALIDRVEQYGLDAISSGVVMGWATEALARGIVSREELQTDLAFGEVKGYLEFLDRLVEQSNDLYRTLGRGLQYAVGRLGGEDFACLHGGLEMAGYHTGYGALLGHSLGARHSHLCNAGYALDQDPELSKRPEEMAGKLIAEEKWRNVLNSLCICLFARSIYDPPTVRAALNAVGIALEEADLQALGDCIFSLKLEAKRLLGFDWRGITFSKRFFETPTPQGRLSLDVVQKLYAQYLRGIGKD
ncbi:MAG: aldehyde ferredoxin oxidoreductase C-terminal domain-containing protein [Bacillota bacterium]